jgi:Cro/C1-type HTH DNA-binding domain
MRSFHAAGLCFSDPAALPFGKLRRPSEVRSPTPLKVGSVAPVGRKFAAAAGTLCSGYACPRNDFRRVFFVGEFVADALMREQGISRTELAKKMKTSRAQLHRLLDPNNESVTLGTLTRAAHAVGRNLRMELV